MNSVDGMAPYIVFPRKSNIILCQLDESQTLNLSEFNRGWFRGFVFGIGVGFLIGVTLVKNS